MRVGTSFDFASCSDFSEDHPHACGDKFFQNWYQSDILGSSPCVWGQADGEVVYVQNGRIIPMRVGTRRNHALKDCQRQDHPHACGDKCVLINT